MNRLLLVASASCLMAACATAPGIYEIETKTVPAAFETAPMVGTGDRADDPALVVNPNNPEASIILGTNKDEGLHVYNLDGEELQFLDVGQINNVDVRGIIAAASNDETHSISWFAVDRRDMTVRHLNDTPTAKTEPYGICTGILHDTYHAAVTYKDGTVQIWQAHPNEDGTVNTDIARLVQLSSQLEGCVFDDEQARLFIGEEGVGVWSLEMSDENSAPQKVDHISDMNGLVADTEGLSLWLGEKGNGYLVVSAQAADRFVVYDRQPPHAVRGVIAIGESEDGTVDAVTHTDGLDVNSAALPGFPRGVLIVQDDGNPASGVDQNFKIVDWRTVEDALKLNK